jgi:hypothetical protein
MSLVADLSERVDEECTSHLNDKAVQLCFRKRVVYIKVGGGELLRRIMDAHAAIADI